MPKRSLNANALYAVFCVAMLFVCALAVAAQSGRRAPKSAPVPVGTPEPEPTPTLSKPEKVKPAFTFIVGMESNGGFSRVPLYVSSGVLRTFASRLDDSQSVAVQVESRDIGRAGAVQRARSEKEAYVVWLQLVQNNFSGRSGATDDSYDVSIEYVVLAPTTAKQVAGGTVFPGTYRNRGVIAPTSSSNGDYRLNQAAKAAAERVLDHFHVGKVPTGP